MLECRIFFVGFLMLHQSPEDHLMLLTRVGARTKDAGGRNKKKLTK